MTGTDASRAPSALIEGSQTEAPVLFSVVRHSANDGAVGLAERFSSGLCSFVAVVGPSGWGKSTLLEATAKAIREEKGHPVFTVPATRWVESKGLVGDIGPVIVDDAQDALKNPRSCHLLRQALAARHRLRRPTMLSFAVSPGHRMRPPVWLASQEWSIGVMDEPCGCGRESVVRALAKVEGVVLGDPVVRLVARHLRGNGTSIRGALQRLKLVKHNWDCREDVCRACGVLMPYVTGENGWDPRDEVFEAVSQTLDRRGPEAKMAAAEVCAFILLHEVGLSEREVATFLSVPPAKAFAMASAVAKKMDGPSPSSSVLACKNAVFDRFCTGE